MGHASSGERSVCVYLWQDLNDVRHDRVLALALERGLELIGEAARRVSEATQARYPQVPWREIIGQRNILAHRYGEIDHAMLLETVVRDLPSLVAELERVLGGADGA